MLFAPRLPGESSCHANATKPLPTLPVDFFIWSDRKDALSKAFSLHTFIHLSFLCGPRRGGSSGIATPVHTHSEPRKNKTTHTQQNFLFSRHPESLTSLHLKEKKNTEALFFCFFPNRCLHPFPSFHPLSVFSLEVKRGRTGGCGMCDRGAEAGGGWRAGGWQGQEGASSFFCFVLFFRCHLSAW